MKRETEKGIERERESERMYIIFRNFGPLKIPDPIYAQNFCTTSVLLDVQEIFSAFYKFTLNIKANTTSLTYCILLTSLLQSLI
mgnify:CR=1 FL=1